MPPEAELNLEQSMILHTFRKKQVPKWLRQRQLGITAQNPGPGQCEADADGRFIIVTEYIVLEYEYGGRSMPCHDHD